jgi:hypothetical protein
MVVGDLSAPRRGQRGLRWSWEDEAPAAPPRLAGVPDSRGSHRQIPEPAKRTRTQH